MQEGVTDAAALAQAASAALARGEQERARELLERAAQLKPNDLTVLLARADYFATVGDQRAAAAHYRGALRYMPRYQQLPPHLQEGLRRAKAADDKVAKELEEHLRAKLEAAGLGPAHAPARFSRAVDVMVGRKRAYVQEPRYLFYPELPQIQFYERSTFPWLDKVEAAFDSVRDELRAVIGGDFNPYVTRTLGRPQGDEKGMLNNPDWSAFFLVKDGAVQPGAERCPQTMAALSEAPLTRIPGRSPSVLFSKLAAGARIPAHTGMLNTRLICHLPLIVPEGCVFRVGNDVRPWREGQAWAFDDTIEHEAHNPSAVDRYILIFDVWRPELSEEERAGVIALCEAIDSYAGKTAWDN